MAVLHELLMCRGVTTGNAATACICTVFTADNYTAVLLSGLWASDCIAVTGSTASGVHAVQQVPQSLLVPPILSNGLDLGGCYC